MWIVPAISIGEFLLKCLDCNSEFTYVTGSNLLELGDRPDDVTCNICKRQDNIITVQTPTVMDLRSINP